MKYANFHQTKTLVNVVENIICNYISRGHRMTGGIGVWIVLERSILQMLRLNKEEV